MLLRNLAGMFTCDGFARREGRRVRAEDCGFVRGPIDVAIAATKIAAVGENLDAAEPVIDCSGCVAMPGFIDPHTHAIFAGERSTEYFLRWAGKTYLEISQAGGGIHSTVRQTSQAPDAELLRLLRERLQAMLSCGATTVEVKSGYADSAAGELRLLRLIRAGTRAGGRFPEVRASFLGLHALPRDRVEAAYVDEMIAALPAVVHERLADHVDSFPEKGFFSLESALRFSEAASRLSLPSKVHADELCDLGSAAAFIRAGALSIDHLQHINDQAVQLLASHPTVATMLPATSFFVGIPYADARRLLDAGARVALATDFNPGTAPAYDLQLTHMLAASEMRMLAAEILCASTYNAAAALGLEKTHGVIAAGRVANLLLYDAPSLEEIVVKRQRPQMVILRGQHVSS